MRLEGRGEMSSTVKLSQGDGKRRTRECQAFQPEWSGKPWLGGAVSHKPEGGDRSGIRLFGQRVEQGKGLIVITSCVGEKNKRAT